MKTSPPERIIITGEKQSGKSTLAEKLARYLIQKNFKVSGIIALGHWKDNQRSKFDLLNLNTQRACPLAERIKTPDREKITGFNFFKSGLAAGKAALDPKNCQTSDFIFIDEIGKFEINGHGWSALLSPALTVNRAVHIWVVRQAFINEVCRLWKVENTQIVSTDTENAFSRLKHICSKEK